MGTVGSVSREDRWLEPVSRRASLKSPVDRRDPALDSTSSSGCQRLVSIKDRRLFTGLLYSQPLLLISTVRSGCHRLL